MRLFLSFILVFVALQVRGQGTPRTLETLSQLLATDPVKFATGGKLTYQVGGYRTNGDWGAPREISWDRTGTALTNLGCVWDTVTTNGQWVAKDCETRELKAEWFGAVAGFLTNSSDSPTLIGTASSSPIQSATDYLAGRGGGTVKFGPGTYWLDETIQVKPRVKYRGASKPTGFIASRVTTSGSTARIAGQTYIDGTTSNGTGFPVFTLNGPLNYTNMFSESFVNLDGDTLHYYSGANEFSEMVISVYKWGWGITNQGPVSGIYVEQVDGVRVQDVAFNNIAGTGIWAQAARGLQIYGCTFMNCLMESVFIAYTSDTRIENCIMGVGGVVYYRANTTMTVNNEIWNPDYSLVNYSGNNSVVTNVDWGQSRIYAVERVIMCSASTDKFTAATQFGADAGTLVFFTGTGIPSPFTTNTAYFAVNVEGDTNSIRIATSPKNALDGTYIDVDDDSTNGAWHLTGTDSIVLAIECEEAFVNNNRMDQSFRHGIEMWRCNRSSANGNLLWEIGANMGPGRRNAYMGPNIVFAGVRLLESDSIQVTGNYLTGGGGWFSRSYSSYRDHIYGVLAESSGHVTASKNWFKNLNAGVYSDADSVDIRVDESYADGSVWRIADSANTNGVNSVQYNGIRLNWTNVVLSAAIPDGFTNLTDFTIYVSAGQSSPSYVGSTNQAYMPLLVLGTSTNYASTDAFSEGSFAVSQYYSNSFSTNWQWIMNLQGSGTNYRRGTFGMFGEEVAKDRPMELMFGRTNGTWWMYCNGMYSQTPFDQISGASPPDGTNSINAKYLILGFWPVLYRDGWIGKVALFNKGFSYSDIVYDRVWGSGTNLVLYWDFNGDKGDTVSDKSGNGVNGTAINLAGPKHGFGVDGAYTLNRFQLWNTNLDTISGLTGGNASNFFGGTGAFKQVTTNDVPGLNTIITSHTHPYLPLAGGSPFGPITSSSTFYGTLFEAQGSGAALWTRVRGATNDTWGFYSQTSGGGLKMYWRPGTGTPYDAFSFNTNGSQSSVQGTFWNSGNDGSGSTLDADLLDGNDSSAFATSVHNHDGIYLPLTGGTMTGSLVLTNISPLRIWDSQLLLSDSDLPGDYGQLIFSDEGYLQLLSTAGGLQLSATGITLPLIPPETASSTNEIQLLVVSTNTAATVNQVNRVARMTTNEAQTLLGIPVGVPVAPTNNGAYVLFVTNGVASWIAHP